MAATVTGVLGVIPARLGSERLPRKPLHPIAGRPLIEWVWRRASTFGILDRLVVATDSPEVEDACRSFGGEATLTDPGHGSGTERVAEVAARTEFAGADVVVNIQGDEPFMTEEQVRSAVDQVRGGWDVGTVAAPITTEAVWRDPAVVKVVRNEAGGALYFSRAPIPHVREGGPGKFDLASGPFLRHIGMYAYTPPALERWVGLPVGALERLERLEQLRPLAAGLRIGVGVVSGGEGGVDTAEDARRAAERLADAMDGDLKGNTGE